LKIISKTSLIKRWLAQKTKGLSDNPFFYFTKNLGRYPKIRPQYYKNEKLVFGVASIFLFLGICASSEQLASLNGYDKAYFTFFSSFSDTASQKSDNLFISQAEAAELQTPDLKIIEGNTLGAAATPYIVSTKVLGDVFGGNSKDSKAVTEYVVTAGDTIQSISEDFGISANTLIWANDMTSSSKLKVGQSLVILPTDGVLHVVKSGDTMDDIAKKYSAKKEDIISYNDLSGESDVYIGDIFIIPGGKKPKSAPSVLPSNNQTPLASNYFIFPTSGTITQGLHYYNAIDVANKCGTGIYAAASGTVQRVRYGYNSGSGNYITILHANGTVTYYGHLQTIFVKSGDKVNVGDRIGLMGNTGYVIGVTGCHLHFQVTGAKNPLSAYAVGSAIKMK